MSAAETSDRPSVAELLVGCRVCICAGSGGVGKTTTSAAIALGMAARGAKVAVVTIDPARRLATSLGLRELGNEPRRIDARRFERAGISMQGELWAMMLDPKRTFDELIERLSPDLRSREEVLSNRIYQELSSAVAGSQEFTAIAKLYELDHEHDFDLIVLDTPPSRHALDFLEAPTRLTQFFEGRALQVFLRPTGLGMRLVGRGTGLVFSVLKRVTGVDLLADLSVFFHSLAGMIDGFKERAVQVEALLRDADTSFLLITSPEPEPVEEALYFHERLRIAGMRFGGTIVNRVHHHVPGRLDEAELRAALAGELGEELAGKVLDSYKEYRALAARDRSAIARVADRLGSTGLVLVPFLDHDVHDLAGLQEVERHLFGSERAPASAAQRAAVS
ncbi:MAG: ArsA family ATPase [Solirubrobacteraceae bacterium]